MARRAEFADDAIRTRITEMAAGGAHPTAFAVRRALGGGNMNRISGILAEWEATSAPVSAQAEVVELPADLQTEVDARMAELSGSLLSTIGRIYRRATEIAEGRVAEAVKETRDAESAVKGELADAKAILAETDAEVDELKGELDQVRQNEAHLRDQCVETREKLAAMTERSQSAERRIGDLSSRVESLTTEADAARERAAAAEARAQEANSERQRALDREHQLTEEMTALRNLVEAKFAQLNK